ncbi:MAG: hypothetical protein KAY65_01155 [Planctomycetes bacterium]|nr:hypothetical protein [Planctomycetota bacterium]
MRTNNRTMLSLILSALTVLCAGCTVEKPIEVVLKPDPSVGLIKQANAPKRFRDSSQEGLTVVESAMELSAKYAKLAEQTAAVKEKNQELISENQRLKDRLVPCDAQLKQAQKELAEANDLLIEMRIELNNWKTDILGFRNEMREANKAEIEALIKILRVLGGETKAESTANNNDSNTSPHDQPDRPQEEALQAATTSGESNG